MQQPAYTVQETAKMLGIGPSKLYAWLKEQHILNDDRYPYQRYIDQGLFTVKRGEWQHPTIGRKYYAKPLVTNKGMAWIEKHHRRQDA